MAEKADPVLAEERRQLREQCAHRSGFPRLRHVSHASQFVFNGMPATKADVQAMEEQRATWITSAPEYRRKLLVEERGDIAHRRHVLEDESADRLLWVLGERDHGRAAAAAHTRRCDETLLAATGRLRLDGARVTQKLSSEGGAIEFARTAVRSHHARAEKKRLEDINAAAPSAAATVGQVSVASSGRTRKSSSHQDPRSYRHTYRQPPLDPEKDRAYLRFVKEGPRRGDGAFSRSKAINGALYFQTILPRATRTAKIMSSFNKNVPSL